MILFTHFGSSFETILLPGHFPQRKTSRDQGFLNRFKTRSKVSKKFIHFSCYTVLVVVAVVLHTFLCCQLREKVKRAYSVLRPRMLQEGLPAEVLTDEGESTYLVFLLTSVGWVSSDVSRSSCTISFAPRCPIFCHFFFSKEFLVKLLMLSMYWD